MAKDANGWAPNDYQSLVNMANTQGAPPEWFAAVMLSESSLKPSAKNKAGYRGLIQFSKDNLRGFGLSETQINNFTNLTPTQQMPFVDRYFKPWRPPTGWQNRAQIYQATYLPATIKRFGSNLNTIITRSPDPNYTSNASVFDPRHKGFITVGDLETRMQDAIEDQSQRWNTALTGIQNVVNPSGFSNIIFHPPTHVFASLAKSNTLALVLGSFVVGASAYIMYQQQLQPVRRRYA